MARPRTGDVETRELPLQADGKRIRGTIPYGIESRDMGGWREVIEPTALRNTKLDDLVAPSTTPACRSAATRPRSNSRTATTASTGRWTRPDHGKTWSRLSNAETSKPAHGGCVSPRTAGRATFATCRRSPN